MIPAWREDLWFVCFGAWAFFVFALVAVAIIYLAGVLAGYIRGK